MSRRALSSPGEIRMETLCDSLAPERIGGTGVSHGQNRYGRLNIRSVFKTDFESALAVRQRNRISGDVSDLTMGIAIQRAAKSMLDVLAIEASRDECIRREVGVARFLHPVDEMIGLSGQRA